MGYLLEAGVKMENKIMKTKQEVINYINTLKGYEGYLQFSHRPIEREKDIFLTEKTIQVDENENGFIYEAHFCNETESIQIRQVNDSWLVSITEISNVDEKDTQEYISDIENFPYKVKMAQIWEDKEDPLCEGMQVKKLTKVVFAGFLKGERT